MIEKLKLLKSKKKEEQFGGVRLTKADMVWFTSNALLCVLV